MEVMPLTAPEALILLNPNQPQGREALKLALTELLARRIITLRQEQRSGFLGSVQNTDLLQAAPDASQRLAGETPLQAALNLLTPGIEMEMSQVVQQAHQAFGADLSGFQKQVILPALVQRGLLETCTQKVLWVIPVTRYCHTTNGTITKERLENQMAQAQLLPEMLDSNPAEAAALVFGLGSAALLVSEVRAQSARLSQALREHPSGADGTFFFPASSTGNAEALADGKTNPANFDDGRFDFQFDLDAFDSSLDSFDSSFDSSADTGGDGGGDGGGGGGED